MILLLVTGCSPDPCRGGDVRGIATDVSPEEGGLVHLYDGESGLQVGEVAVAGYRRFVFPRVTPGEYSLDVEFTVSDPLGVCDCWSDVYFLRVCDEPVEVYPGVDPATEEGSGCICYD